MAPARSEELRRSLRLLVNLSRVGSRTGIEVRYRSVLGKLSGAIRFATLCLFGKVSEILVSPELPILGTSPDFLAFPEISLGTGYRGLKYSQTKLKYVDHAINPFQGMNLHVYRILQLQ